MKKSIFYSSFLLVSLFFFACGQEKETAAKGVPVEITGQDFKEQILDIDQSTRFKGDRPVFVEFYDKDCHFCRKFAPVVAAAARRYAGQLSVYKIDIMKNQDLARKLQINGTPTSFFFKPGITPYKIVGFLDQKSLLKALDRELKPAGSS